MKKFIAAFLAALILYAFYLMCYSVLHGELNLYNDVARDFLLLQELDQKKLVFIGPRSSTNGLYYGSLLTYLNYPAYLLGQGNPVVVAWGWVVFAAAFLVSGFYMVKKLFGLFPALTFTLLCAIMIVPHMNAIFEPVALYFVIPFFIFTIVRYVQTRKTIFLLLHMVALGIFLQFSVGIAIQFLILSVPIILYTIWKAKTYKQLLAFFVLPLTIANLILFDIKNGFRMTKALISTGESSKFFITIPDWIANRFNNVVSLELYSEYTPLLFIIFVIVMGLTIYSIRTEKKTKSAYILFLIYYFGYMLLSYFNKGILLVHYVYFLIPFTVLWITSFLRKPYLFLSIPIVIIVFVLNLQFAQNYTASLTTGFIGKNPNSWIGLSNTAKVVLEKQKGKEFGYFVFAPDSFAYQPRYAMIYNFRNTKAYEYEKKQTTYVIAQPPPVNDKYMDYQWWVKVPVGITKKPKHTTLLPNGYRVLEYELTSEEQKVPHDKAIELGIHFR